MRVARDVRDEASWDDGRGHAGTVSEEREADGIGDPIWFVLALWHRIRGPGEPQMEGGPGMLFLIFPSLRGRRWLRFL